MYSVLALYTDKMYKMVHVHYVINFTILSSSDLSLSLGLFLCMKSAPESFHTTERKLSVSVF